MKETIFLSITGRVQGVGFRPFVSNLAKSLDLRGYIQNNAHGVEIAIQGKRQEEFVSLLQSTLPPMAKIKSIKILKKQDREFERFEIWISQSGNQTRVLPIPDFCICQDCSAEILDKRERRFFYPLINCTNCGPRFSVIEDFPYDRERTSMKRFVMCQDCLDEYSDGQSRFFHAQPISCPKCSPQLFWRGQERKDYQEVFQEIADAIKNAEIVCLQGIGGFHLVCDATQEKAVQSLRILKDRPTKPLALMCRDLNHVRQIAYTTPKEEELLTSPEAPIVLLESKNLLQGIAKDRYGIMLAYSPIHKLLFEFLDIPLVATSANPKGEPIVYEALEAQRLFSLNVLSHAREILSPIEDSIAQVLSTQDVLMLRNARGYAPMSFVLDEKVPYPILAMGANQKSSFALAFENFVIISPYIGDLDNLVTLQRFQASIQAFQKLYSLEFKEVICDLHPRYESTKLAFAIAQNPTQIQHHYAHALSVCFEHHLTHEVLSFCFDGTGYGEDGKIWGGEVLVSSGLSYKRVLHFAYFSLLGGEIAIKEIHRNFFSLLCKEKHGADEEIEEFFIQRGKTQQELKNLRLMQEKNLNSPLTSSVGRIFDAIAWVCGLEIQSYEGESGEFLQSLYDETITQSYNFEINDDEIVLDFWAIFVDARNGEEARRIASKFLNTLVLVVLEIAGKYSYDVVLCGGVFCNRILSSKVLESLRAQNKNCYIGNKIPPNDQGIAVGQIYHLIQRSKNAR